MGKGSRNRVYRAQDKIENPKKYQKPKQAPKWLTPVISLVLAIGILVAVVVSSLINNGNFKRGNIIIKSQTGKYNVTEQMATYFAWESVYYNAMYYAYYSSDLQTQLKNNNMTVAQYALSAAQTGISKQLRDCLDDVVDSIKNYVAVCDEAYNKGVRLTDEDQKEITESLDWLKKMQSEYGYSSLNAFLKVAMGTGMKESDVRKALELACTYNKYSEMLQEDFKKAIVPADLEKYRDDNPESFYSTDYLLYETTDKALAELIHAETTADGFKTVIAKDYFDDNYKELFNLYVAKTNADIASESVSGKTTAEDFNAALDTISAGEEKQYKNNDSGIGTDLKKWLFGERKDFDTTVISGNDGYTLVAFISSSTEDDVVTVTVREKDFPKGTDEGTSFEGNDEFRATMYANYMDNLGLPHDDYTCAYQSDAKTLADRVYFAVLDLLQKEAEKLIPTDKTAAYVKNPTAGSYQEWLFSGIGENLTSVVKAGETKTIEKKETKDSVETVTYQVYMAVNEPMYYDTDKVVAGGYLLYSDSTADATKGADSAEAGKTSLAGKTGKELTEALSALNTSASVSEAFAESTLESADANLKAWFFDAARAENDIAVIANAKNDGAYLAVYTGSTLAWKHSAEQGFISEKLKAKVAELAAGYTVSEKALNKVGKPTPTTEAVTTGAETESTNAAAGDLNG